MTTLEGKTKMTGSNPYIIKAMIPPGSDMFFGRQAEMRRIKERLCADSPQSVSLIGERRIGKSSLAFCTVSQKELDQLVSKEVLAEREMRYCFPVNLSRKWVAARYPLRRVREEIQETIAADFRG